MSSTLLLYGIPNCDSVKKARKWLNENGLEYSFVDFRKDGIDQERIATWVQSAGLEKVLNKRGTTWRKLSPEQQNFDSEVKAVELMQAEPTLIKRPVLEAGNNILVGFNESEYQLLDN